MKSILVLNFLSIFSSLYSVSAYCAHSSVPTAILVDKKTNTLYVSEIRDGIYHVIDTHKATVGKVKGDKEEEGDLKTPEGIFTVRARRTAPGIQPKLGAMAFDLDFPNAYDRIAGRGGSNILLHATNEPERLKKDYDSEGCVVVRNEDIAKIDHKIRVGLTPVLIFAEMTQEYLKPGKNPKLLAFFQNWVQAWENKKIDPYIQSYHSDFSAQGMTRSQWRVFKDQLNHRYHTIQVAPEDVLVYQHPKYSVITFSQNYVSKNQKGQPLMTSRGTKVLYVAEEMGEPKIIAETFTQLMW